MTGELTSLLVVLEESAQGAAPSGYGISLAARLGCGVVFQLPIPMEHIEAKSAASLERAVIERQEQCRERAAPWFEAAVGLAKAQSVDNRTVLTIDEEPLAAVLRVATENACQMIVVASHGRGAVERALHGSLVADLIRQSHVPVLVCREDMKPGRFGAPASADDETPAEPGQGAKSST